jgi:hypothetical protein
MALTPNPQRRSAAIALQAPLDVADGLDLSEATLHVLL